MRATCVGELSWTAPLVCGHPSPGAPAPGLVSFGPGGCRHHDEGGPMATAAKAAAIAELTDQFRNSGAAVLTEYRGLTVAQLTELRRSLREHATYAVVKNTITQLAASAACLTDLD